MPKVTQILGEPEAKKHVVRYNADEDHRDPPLSNVYINKAALHEIGDPPRIKVTIEPAD